jgi:hypothetical protein
MANRWPNLFLVGAMRAGTTALHEVLDRHPDISMSSFKEPAHFADPSELAIDSAIVSGAGYAGDSRAYLSLFAGAGNVPYLGESSTHYTKLPRLTGIAPRIASRSPDARIVYLVRDPVLRTISHYRFAVYRKRERRSCLEALRSEPFYVAVSDYAMQLAPYLEVFGPKQVHVLTLEDIVADASHEIGHLCAWLGLSKPHPSPTFPQRNETAEVAKARGPAMLHRVGTTRAYRKVAGAVVPASLRRRVRAVLTTSLDDGVSDPAVVDFLRDIHEPQVERFEDVTGRTFDRWTTLRPA